MTAAPSVGADVLVIGAGIAGASVAHALAPQARVIVLDRETQPGYHSTGRSAAQYIASYGPPQVRALTIASREFLQHPPAGFAEVPLLKRRATLTVGFAGEEVLLDQAWDVLRAVTDSGERLGADATHARVPVLRRERLIGAIHESDSFDIDVHALLQGYLRGLRRAGGRVVTGAEVTALRHYQGRWQVSAGGASYEAPVLVNAAGAWCDVIATLAGVRPIGLVPRRRSALTFAPPAGVETGDWPLVIAADHGWYFKPDAGQLLGSPANEDATEPQDVQPEEMDIALAMHRIEQATTMTVRPTHTWAGLRSFAPDGELVGGWDPQAPGFFWIAGQGGYGIQTSPAMGTGCAALLMHRPLPRELQAQGLSQAMLSPERLRPSAAPH
jgi:D-arginine dehydrogenase